MKKIILSLLPILLMMTACEGGGTVNPSGGDEPSSETPSSESSSEEPQGFATIEEVFETLMDGSFTLDVKDEYYMTGDEEDKDVILHQLRVDQKKLEGLEYVEEDESGHFETVCFADFSDDETVYSYTKANGYWLEEEGVPSLVGNIEEFLEMAYNVIFDIIHPSEVEWAYDEENGLYTGTLTQETSVTTCSLQLTHTFFSELKICYFETPNGLHNDVIIEATEVGTTVVVLPDTPISTICSGFNAFGNSFLNYESFTLDYLLHTEMDGDVTSDEHVIFEYQTFDTADIHAEVIKATQFDDPLDYTYYTKLTEISTSAVEYYYYNDVREQWIIMREYDFSKEIGELYFYQELLAMEQDDLAFMVKSVEEVADSQFDFTLNDTLERVEGFFMNVHVEFVGADLGVIRSTFSGEVLVGGVESTVNFEQRMSVGYVNNTEFDFPSF